MKIGSVGWRATLMTYLFPFAFRDGKGNFHLIMTDMMVKLRLLCWCRQVAVINAVAGNASISLSTRIIPDTILLPRPDC